MLEQRLKQAEEKVASMRAQVVTCEREVARAFESGGTGYHLAIMTSYAAQAFLSVAELELDLCKTKIEWEERWSRRWEP